MGKLIHGLRGWHKLISERMALYQAGRPTFRVAQARVRGANVGGRGVRRWDLALVAPYWRLSRRPLSVPDRLVAVPLARAERALRGRPTPGGNRSHRVDERELRFLWPRFRRRTSAAAARGNCVLVSSTALPSHSLQRSKKELIYRHVWPTRRPLVQPSSRSWQGWYNRVRLHSTLNYSSPHLYEEDYYRLTAAT
jgi:hypothetical protein